VSFDKGLLLSVLLLGKRAKRIIYSYDDDDDHKQISLYAACFKKTLRVLNNEKRQFMTESHQRTVRRHSPMYV